MRRLAWILPLVLLAGGCGEEAGGRGFVRAVSGELELDGARFRFVGANRYDVASFPPGSGKFYCGRAYRDGELDQLLGELAETTGTTVLRAWAFEGFTDGGSDFTSLDRLIAAARRHGLKLILTLENQWKDCTEADPASPNGEKSAAWYQGGYLAPLGQDRLGARDYVQLVAAHYRNEPAIAMWQLMNEAECTDGAALAAFASDLAGAIKRADPNHLVSLGTIGSGQPGTSGAAYRALHAIFGIDVVEAHDYHDESVALPPAIASDLADARALGKPFFVGEAGIAAPSPMYPYSYAERASLMDAKIAAEWAAGADGFLVWSWYDLTSDNSQGWDFRGTDPLAAVLAKHAAEKP